MSPIDTDDLRQLLDRESARINRPSFADSDPVQFPRRYTDLKDIEVSALLCSMIAWGNRKMICRNCDRMMSLLNDEPGTFAVSGDIETIPDDRNIHRTFFGRDLKYFLRGMRLIYSRYDSLDAMCGSLRLSGNAEAPWLLMEQVQKMMREANGGRDCVRCFPTNLQVTALKRFNMALRWLVRRDGLVDLGVWKSLEPSDLYIPLDVHVGRLSRQLGLLVRKSNDRKAVVELTEHLRSMRPDDPAVYDFALFGLGIEASAKGKQPTGAS